MQKTDFHIVFERLAEASMVAEIGEDGTLIPQVLLDELDEIAELRRLAAELSTPDITSFTTT